MKIVHNKDGFSLIELLVAVALSVIIMAAIYSTFYSQQKSFLVQEQLAAMEQNLRAAMFYMERDIRMAGCDPTRKAGAGVTTADATSLRFTEDIDGDTVPVSIFYSLYTDTDGIQKLGRTAGGGAIPVADNIEVIDFV
ncbi:MAG: prepilin-type N-terminal cleavage/methylation domain-containing protein, partial [Desulfobacteraceae bacterium]